MRRETMVYVGLDVHKEFCQACVIDRSGRVLSNERFSSTQEELDEFLDGFRNAKFVLESTGIWEFIGIVRRNDTELTPDDWVKTYADPPDWLDLCWKPSSDYIGLGWCGSWSR